MQVEVTNDFEVDGQQIGAGTILPVVSLVEMGFLKVRCPNGTVAYIPPSDYRILGAAWKSE